MTNQPVPPPMALSPKPPRKRTVFSWLRMGCLLLLLLACGSWVAVNRWQNRQQDRYYQAGDEAYSQADCVSAIDYFDKALAIDPLPAASTKRENCQAYLTLVESQTQGRWVEALLGYSQFVDSHPIGPLTDDARLQAVALFEQAGTAALAEDKICKGIDKLHAQELIPEADANLPPLYLACGQHFEAIPDYTLALYFYDRFRTEYPDHALAEAVQAAYVRTVIAQADVSGAGSLPQPEVVASKGTGPSIVVIRNDSPEEMSLYFSGPVVRIEELGPCADCQTFSGAGPEGCPELGPVGEYTLPPGTYDVIVASVSSTRVTPFRGQWQLNSGEEYASCFYLVQGVP